MTSYGPLASSYDALTGDVQYSAYADLYEAEFRRDGGEFRLLLDLCCGTGSLTQEMSNRGYEMIAADASVEMLMQAQSKDYPGTRPLFLCQRAEDLDLYGTVDAAYSSLDSFNYLSEDILPEVFHRLHLFIRPGGLLIFDIRDSEWLKALDGEIFVDETEDTLCLWRAEFDTEENCIVYGIDLFTKTGRSWRRDKEEHYEYAHTVQELFSLLIENGFIEPEILNYGPDRESGRLFIKARRSL